MALDFQPPPPFDHPGVDLLDRGIDVVPILAFGESEAGGAVAGAQRGIAGIGFERVGIAVDVAGLDQGAGDAVDDQAGRAGGGRRDDGQRAGHRFQRDVAKRLGDRGVEQDVGAGERAGDIAAVLVAEEDGIGQAFFEPRRAPGLRR